MVKSMIKKIRENSMDRYYSILDDILTWFECQEMGFKA